MNQLYSIESDIDSLNEQIANYESSQGSDSAMSIEQYDEDIRVKQNALEELIVNLNKTKNENDLQNKTNTLEIEAKKKEIDNLNKKIEKIKQENSITEIKSEYSGIVSSISAKIGEETVPDVPVAGGGLFTYEYCCENADEIQKVYIVKYQAKQIAPLIFLLYHSCGVPTAYIIS